LFSILALISAILAPLSSASPLNLKLKTAPTPEQGGATYKYEAYAGAAYTRLRQVPVSYSGLVGGKASLARDWGKYFQLMASGDYYSVGTGRSNLQNPGNPTVYTFLVGPALHADLFWKLSGQAFAQVGGEHTGGENMTPSISFAGGFGAGLDYNLKHNLAVRLTGDRIAASFSLPGATSENAYSTHRTWNARGSVGVVYRF
jgi:hypothetical protein